MRLEFAGHILTYDDIWFTAERVGVRLGPGRDSESDGQPSLAANGDDTSGSPDDEDGVTAATVAGATAQLTGFTSGSTTTGLS